MDSDSDVAIASFDALPPTLLRVIFLALPVDARAQAARVCRSWRAFLADPSLWHVLDMSYASGLAPLRVTENLVRGAVARAAGGLRIISLNYEFSMHGNEVLVNLVESDGAELQELTTGADLEVEEQLAAICAAAPKLQVLKACVVGECTELLPVLRNEPPYGPVRVSQLEVACESGPAVADVLALAAAVASHESLRNLSFEDLQSARGLNALVDAAAERRLVGLQFTSCAVDAETVPALVRLLQRGSLQSLEVNCEDFPEAPEESLPVLCAALRACRTLVCLKLSLSSDESANRHTFTELLDAAAALPELAELDLSESVVQDGEGAAVGRSFGVLLGANLPKLHTLTVHTCFLGDEGVAAMLDGLATNVHLRYLDCERENDLSEAFKRRRLEPALAALEARAEALMRAELDSLRV